MSKFDGITTEELQEELKRRDNIDKVMRFIGSERIVSIEEDRFVTGCREITITTERY